MSPESNSTYSDYFELDSSVRQEVTRASEDQIHTRVMIQDVDATGYHIESAEVNGGGAVFTSIDPDIFQARLTSEYPELVAEGDFVTNITAEEYEEEGGNSNHSGGEGN